MNPLMKKELRQMGPDGLVVGLALAAFPWVRPGEEWVVPGSTIALFFGIVMVSVNAFGREFGGGTFAFMLTQPVERRRLWRAKIGGLTGVTALIYSLFLASTAMRLMMGSNPANHWYWVGLGNLRPEEWRDWFLGTLLCLLVAGSSGLWSILLVRLSAAAFWISFLTPFALLLGLSLLFPRDLPDWLEKNIGLLALTVYLLAGFWLARRLFYRAQVVGWGGWTISLSG